MSSRKNSYFYETMDENLDLFVVFLCPKDVLK